jgi:hypothetical protein
MHFFKDEISKDFKKYYSMSDPKSLDSWLMKDAKPLIERFCPPIHTHKQWEQLKAFVA